MALTRTEGWEMRLLAAVHEVSGRPFKLGKNDCLTAACASIRALSGVDLWPQFEGKYRTPFGVTRFIIKLAGRLDFTAAFSAICGSEPVDTKLARRGDILELRDTLGNKCLAVCVGAYALAPTDQGWQFGPTGCCVHAWRIG